jgi:hypothetical protein
MPPIKTVLLRGLLTQLQSLLTLGTEVCDTPTGKPLGNVLQKKLDPWDEAQYHTNIVCLKLDYVFHCRMWGKCLPSHQAPFVNDLNCWGNNKLCKGSKVWMSEKDFERLPFWNDMDGWLGAWIHIHGMSCSNPTGKWRTQAEIDDAHKGYL